MTPPPRCPESSALGTHSQAVGPSGNCCAVMGLPWKGCQQVIFPEARSSLKLQSSVATAVPSTSARTTCKSAACTTRTNCRWQSWQYVCTRNSRKPCSHSSCFITAGPALKGCPPDQSSQAFSKTSCFIFQALKQIKWSGLNPCKLLCAFPWKKERPFY